MTIPPCYPNSKGEHHHPTGGFGACHPGAPWECAKAFCVEHRQIKVRVSRAEITAWRLVADQLTGDSTCACGDCGPCAARRQAEHLRRAADSREYDITHHPLTGELL